MVYLQVLVMVDVVVVVLNTVDVMLVGKGTFMLK
jgi:hypothetical protein